jgi:hypothetical protein
LNADSSDSPNEEEKNIKKKKKRGAAKKGPPAINSNTSQVQTKNTSSTVLN